LEVAQLLKRVLHPRRDRTHMLSDLQRDHAVHGEAVETNLPFMKMVSLFGPDANRYVLMDPDRVFSARKPWMFIMGRIFPNGLLLMDGDEHKSHRKIIHTAFKRPRLRDYAARMNPMVAREISDWSREGDRILAFPKVKQLTLDMASRIFIGLEPGAGTGGMKGAFEDMVAASMSKVKLPIPGSEFQRGLQARKFMVDFIGSRIGSKRAGDEQDAFAHLCRVETEEGERFDDQQIIDHMSFLMMAAHDTTTSTLSSMIYELARHPEWQERVREESRALGESELGFDDVGRFEATGWVMRETLRRYPPLPIIPRTATEDIVWNGHAIPKGALVIVSPIVTHHMSEWWEDPYRFDPERFAPTRMEHERHSHSWIPFGGGAHMCLGLRFAETQVKIVMHHLARTYRWSIDEGYEMPVQQAPISKPMDGLPIRLERLI
jgi:cytochrome P450